MNGKPATHLHVNHDRSGQSNVLKKSKAMYKLKLTGLNGFVIGSLPARSINVLNV